MPGNLHGPVFTLVTILLLTGCVPPALPAAIATPTPEPVTHPPDEEPTELLRVLRKLPLEFKQAGIWFADGGRALDTAGVPHVHTLEEWQHLEEEELLLYRQANFGVMWGQGPLGNTRSFLSEWQELYGFNYLDVKLMLHTGASSMGPFPAVTYAEGAFDPQRIQTRLQQLGYEQQQALGYTFYTYGEDERAPADLELPRVVVRYNLNRIYVEDGRMVAAPSTARLMQVLETWAGVAPALADDPTLRAVAQALGDPLAAVFLTREALLQPEFMDPVAYDKPEDWGALHEWELLGIAYGRAAIGEHWWTFSLFYPDPETAQADVPEMEHRVESFVLHDPTHSDQVLAEERAAGEAVDELRLLRDFCDPREAGAEALSEGSVLTMQCSLPEAPEAAALWWSLIDMRNVGFLIP